MNKQTLDKIVDELKAIKGGDIKSFGVRVLLNSGQALNGILHTPVGNNEFVRVDVARTADAHLSKPAIPSFIALASIAAVVLDS